ncbi:pseudouridine synthase [Acinetobacter sp. c1-l78]|uniref:pseudouridine synthase n=1 Tax=Acinetobacter sp. c1-l78 TaxID=3342803 RepID=UPI0035B8736F
MKKLSADKILHSQGLGTRKQCQYWIKQGEVSINGEIVKDLKQTFDTDDLQFQVFGENYHFYEKIYIALHKPKGYECSHQTQYHLPVFDLLPEHFIQRGIQSVGRLDQDTSGLLLLSDDGQFLHRLTHPKKHIKKYYRVDCRDAIDDEQIAKLQQGVTLHNEKGIFCALDVEQLGKSQLRFAIEQGVFHQVKRMMHAVNNDVVALHREQIGQLNLAQLELDEREWCYLTPADLEKLQFVEQ